MAVRRDADRSSFDEEDRAGAGVGVEDEAAVWSYAIIYHLVVILPQILLGAIATTQTSWRPAQPSAREAAS